MAAASAISQADVDALPEFDISEVAKHNKEGDLWIVIDAKVYDVSMFVNLHPGGADAINRVAGTDATEQFWGLHRASHLAKFEKKLLKGKVRGQTVPEPRKPGSLSLVPFAEWESPFETEQHKQLRRECRAFVEEHILPFADQWVDSGEFDPELTKKMADFGYVAMSLGKGPHLNFAPRLPAGFTAETFDYIAEKVAGEEIKRAGWSLVDGILGGLVIGAPPIQFGSKDLRKKVLKDIVQGRSRTCLAITEATGGSDVSNLQTTAVKSPDGSHYIVNGAKKWITSSTTANWATTAVRTGGAGHGGVSLLLIDLHSEGVEIKKIKTAGSSVAGTGYITYDNVKVPTGNLLGMEGQGFALTMMNFAHERWSMALAQCALNRVIIEELMVWAYVRKAFGKRLIDQPQIQERLAECVAASNAASAYVDAITARMNKMSYKEITTSLTGEISLVKNQSVEASRLISNHAYQIMGGRAITSTGMGARVEDFLRVAAGMGSVLGGANSVLATQAMRMALKKFPKNAHL